MREEIAKLVFPVLEYGIRLKEQIAGDDPPDFHEAQKTLLALLHTPTTNRDFTGDGPITSGDHGGRSNYFMGIRYALACWLDEIFIDSPWKDLWDNNKLETAIYSTNDRAWKFW